MTSLQPVAERPLTDYPRPSVAVDTAVLTVPLDERGGPSGGLHVLLVRRIVDLRAEWLLPGTFLHEGERLRDAVLRSLRDKAGVQGLSPRQLHVFDDPARDDRGWVLSVAHVDTVPWERVAALRDRDPSSEPRTRLCPVADAVGLPFDHDAIVAHAVDVLRADYREHPDPAALLPEPFTLRQLQQVHEAVLGRPLAKDGFRRRMEPLLEPAGGLSAGSVGKPARLFCREPAERGSGAALPAGKSP